MSPLAYARAYAALGWRVHPCHWIVGTGCSCGNPEHVVGGKAGKHPTFKGWPERATTNPDLIDRWWTRTPLANVAVATGHESGVLVLDVDGSEGERSLIELERRHGPLPEIYPMQWTGGGKSGWQAFFAYPQGRTVGNSGGKLGAKVDTRGSRGYALVPPSVTVEPYRWAIDRSPWAIAPEPAPAWLIDLLDPPEAPRDPWPIQSVASRGNGINYALRALETELALVAIAPAGRRNDQLNASAHALFRFVEKGHLPADVIRRGLLAAALHADLPEREALNTISSAARARGIAA